VDSDVITVLVSFYRTENGEEISYASVLKCSGAFLTVGYCNAEWCNISQPDSLSQRYSPPKNYLRQRSARTFHSSARTLQRKRRGKVSVAFLVATCPPLTTKNANFVAFLVAEELIFTQMYLKFIKYYNG